jgi:hypothetical protein
LKNFKRIFLLVGLGAIYLILHGSTCSLHASRFACQKQGQAELRLSSAAHQPLFINLTKSQKPTYLYRSQK